MRDLLVVRGTRMAGEQRSLIPKGTTRNDDDAEEGIDLNVELLPSTPRTLYCLAVLEYYVYVLARKFKLSAQTYKDKSH